jgi:hypothetical protein
MDMTPWEDLVNGRSDQGRERDEDARTRTEPAWAKHPVWAVVNGVELELHPIGALAMALGRSPRTLRRWEHDGVIPPCCYWRRFDDVNARRRLYTRATIEGLVRIAAMEGVLGGKVADFALTHFSARAAGLYRALRQEEALRARGAAHT